MTYTTVRNQMQKDKSQWQLLTDNFCYTLTLVARLKANYWIFLGQKQVSFIRTNSNKHEKRIADSSEHTRGKPSTYQDYTHINTYTTIQKGTE